MNLVKQVFQQAVGRPLWMWSMNVGKWLNTTPHSSHWHVTVSVPCPLRSSTVNWECCPLLGEPGRDSSSGKAETEPSSEESVNDGESAGPGEGERLYILRTIWADVWEREVMGVSKMP